MNPIKICLAAASDLPAVLDMIHALAAHHDDVATLSLGTLRRDVLGDAPWIKLIIAQSGPELLGYAALYPLAQLQFGVRGMDMHHLFVKADARGRGVGKALIKASIDHAKAAQCRFLMVGTHPDNLPAQQMYISAGFSSMPEPGPRFRMKFDAD
ncbi:MAG: GNAT family N-acetyltransferase [Sulfitobacter sp.]